MPECTLIYYREDADNVPLEIWLEDLIPKAREKCLARLKRLEDVGHELRRPEADYLRDGIYELRAGLQGVNYRMLYFFYGRSAVVVSHGIMKERDVPSREIDAAVIRKSAFESAPERHGLKRKR
jgi:phage-related protein